MHRTALAAVLGTTAIISVIGCTSGTSIGGGGGPSTTVTFTFTGGTPTAAATQTGTGAFTTASITGGKLVVTLPNSTTPYGIAYVCPPVPGMGNTVTSEFIIQATPTDGTAFTVSCFGAPATGSATGSVSVTSIPGATKVTILGAQGIGGTLSATSGSFNFNLPSGTNDVAVIAEDASNNVLAVKIIRNQTVPGAINGGNQIVLATTDQVSAQSMVINNLPAGDVNPPAASVTYLTAKGTTILLENSSATNYPAVPPTATQSGDFYSFESNTNDTATHNSAIGVTLNTSTGGGFQTLNLPVPWSFAGPAAASFPIFTFNYTGFNGLAVINQQAEIEWAPTATTLNTITVTATGSFQGSNITITIPNLTSLPGFMAPASPGTTIDWVADIFGGTTQSFAFFAAPPADGSVSFVQNRGTFTQP